MRYWMVRNTLRKIKQEMGMWDDGSRGQLDGEVKPEGAKKCYIWGKLLHVVIWGKSMWKGPREEDILGMLQRQPRYFKEREQRGAEEKIRLNGGSGTIWGFVGHCNDLISYSEWHWRCWVDEQPEFNFIKIPVQRRTGCWEQVRRQQGQVEGCGSDLVGEAIIIQGGSRKERQWEVVRCWI